MSGPLHHSQEVKDSIDLQAVSPVEDDTLGQGQDRRGKSGVVRHVPVTLPLHVSEAHPH